MALLQVAGLKRTVYACAGLLLLGACAARPQLAVGGLEIDSRGDVAVAISARWYSPQRELHGALAGWLLPGTDGFVRIHDEIPAGTVLRFQALDRAASGSSEDPIALGTAFVWSGEPPEVGELSRVDAEWTYPGGEASIVVVAGADGAVRILER